MIASSPAVRPSAKPPTVARAASSRRTLRQPITDADVACIRRHIGSMPITHIARLLGRDPTVISYTARKLGLLPPVARQPRKRGYVEPRYDAERETRQAATLAELHRLCRLAHIPVTRLDSPIVLARRLMAATAWRPLNIIVACDLNLDDEFTPRPAVTPTNTQPGTPERVAVYMARVERGEEIWHPGDANP